MRSKGRSGGAHATDMEDGSRDNEGEEGGGSAAVENPTYDQVVVHRAENQDSDQGRLPNIGRVSSR